MKKLILTTTTVLFIGITSFAQEFSYSENLKIIKPGTVTDVTKELNFEVRGDYSRPVKKGILTEANSLGDIIQYYPVNWITEYISVEISTTTNGKTLKALSSNDVLNNAQKQILKTVDLASVIDIKVNFRAENSVTGIMEDHVMNVLMTVIPEVEAQYPGGSHQIRKYLREAVMNKLNANELEQARIIFIIDEEGSAVNVIMTQSTGNNKADKLLINSITNMPKWIPAQNSNGKKVKQDFVFQVGNSGC